MTAGLLSACGGGDGPSGVATVRVWAHEGQPAEKAALDSIAAAFNRSQDTVRMEIHFKQEQGYGDRVRAAALTGGLPDLLEVDGPYTAHFADLGVLAPLEGIIPKGIAETFYPSVLHQATYRGRLYTLGAFESTVVLYYRPDVLRECGLEPPSSTRDAWKWDEFLEALRAVRERRPGLLPLETFHTWGGEWLTYAFTPLIHSNGGDLLSPHADRAGGFLNSSQAVEALEEWQRLFAEGLADRAAPPGRFRHGKAAMAWGLFNRWPLYQEEGLDFAMAPLPGIQRSVSPSGSWCWGAVARETVRPEVRDALGWLLHPEHGIAPLCRANGGIPARPGAVKWLPGYAETRGLFLEQMAKTARARPTTPHYGSFTQTLSRALEDIARGSDVSTVLNRAARELDPILARASGPR